MVDITNGTKYLSHMSLSFLSHASLDLHTYVPHVLILSRLSLSLSREAVAVAGREKGQQRRPCPPLHQIWWEGRRRDGTMGGRVAVE